MTYGKYHQTRLERCARAKAYLYLGILLAGVDVVAALDKEAHELAGARAAQLGGVVLLLDQARLRVDHQTQRADFLSPVDRMALAVKQNQ